MRTRRQRCRAPRRALQSHATPCLSNRRRPGLSSKPRDAGEGDRGRGCAVLADTGLQRHFLRRAVVPGGERAVADFRRHAHRQPVARLVFPARRLCRLVGDLDHRLLAVGDPGCRRHRRADRPGDGAGVFATIGFRSAAAGVADGRFRLLVPAGRARYLDRQSVRHQSASGADANHRGRRPAPAALPHLHDRRRFVHRAYVVAGHGKDPARRHHPRHRRRCANGARRRHRHVLHLDADFRARRLPGGARRRHRRRLPRRLSRPRFRNAADRLCGGDHRRHGQPRRRRDRRADCRARRQFRQGAVSRNLLLHALRADGLDPGGEADRAVRTGMSMARDRVKILIVVSALVAVALIVPHTTSFIILLATRALAFSILVMSLDLLLGFTGLASLGQAAYLGVGAYLTAILAARYQVGLGYDFWLVIVFGMLGAAALAALFGLLATRATGVYFLMITLALGQCVWGLAYRWNSLTGGDNGINLQHRPKFGIDLANPVTFFYVVFGCFAVSLLVLYTIVRSPFGRSLVGIREREPRMKILGYNTWLHKYIAFIIAGAFGGLSGVLWAHTAGIVSPENVVLTTSVDALLMAVLGGAGTLVGGVIGAGVVLFIREYLSTLVHWWQYLPGGLMSIPGRVRQWRGAAEFGSGAELGGSSALRVGVVKQRE